MAIIDNLISAWLFDGDATDEHGSNDGSPTGIDYTTGVIGQAAVFAQSSDIISVADDASLNFDAEDFSISVWVNPDYITGQRCIVRKSSTNQDTAYIIYATDQQVDFLLWQDGQKIYFGFAKNGSAFQYAVSGNVLSTGWQHITATYKDSTKAITIYRNGVSVASATASYSPGSGSGGVTIGKTSGGSDYYYGDIDQLCIYGACLTVDDALDLYADGDGWAYPFYPKISAGTFESTGTLTGDFQMSAMKAGTFESTGTLTGAGKQADLGHFWATAAHEDGGEYNTASICKIAENGYRTTEIFWSDIDAGYTDYLPREIAVDNNDNLYVIGQGDQNKVYKLNSEGEVQWTFNVATGAATHVICDPTGTYIYIANEYMDARLTKINGSTGVEITTGDWPLTTAQIDVPDCHTLIYGRDGYIYMSDATLAAVLVGTTGVIQKIDPDDGSIEWNWRVNADYNRHLYCIAVNDSGVVVATHDGITTNQVVSILGSDGITDRTWQSDGNFQLDSKRVAIDDAGYIYGNNAWSGLFKCIATQTWNPYGHEEWVTDQHGFYSLSPDDVYLYGSKKIQTSNGSVVWSMDADLIELNNIKFSGTMPIRSAWLVTITNSANGSIFTNIGVELSNGDFVVADGDDLTLTVTPDDGYLVKSVKVNGEAV